MATATAASTQRLIIEPGRAVRQYWSDLWRFRELLYFLSWRDISVHYKQTIVGAAWVILRPLLMVIAFVLVFNKLARINSPDIPYPLLVLAGMLPWQMFATAVSESSNSLVTNANLVSKVYFPRLLVPVASVAVSMVDLAVSSPLLVILMWWYGVAPSWRIAALPLFVLFGAVSAVSVGIWLCALNVRYRDVRYVVPFMVQFGLYLSPVGFPSTKVPPEYRFWFSLNPMTGVIDGVRWSLFGASDGVRVQWAALACSAGLVLGLMLIGLSYFRATERTFADVI